ncbi:hypothetical protein [Vibrio agarivorans]|uniref:Uncharacterized protein n=1 Tax=Vibrio agarivorans TaxID=153622 RepID=A0ABT7Y706_9VIBR|nr:hypothetical protein [Vibrio agarivorans]MDN2483782.1 hypothetical protein [Vibrio agarivorans]
MNVKKNAVLRFKSALICGLMVVSVGARANHPLFFPFVDVTSPLIGTSQAYEDEVTFECSERESQWRYCAEFNYYQVPVFAYFYSHQGQIDKAVLELESSPVNFTQLQYNLRRDGFEPVLAVTNNGRFDVIERLKKAPEYQVNAELVQFINQRPIDGEMEMTWVNNSNNANSAEITATLIYKVETLTLGFTRTK